MNKTDFKLCVMISGAAFLLSSCGSMSRRNNPNAVEASPAQNPQISPSLEEAQEAQDSKDPTTRRVHQLEKENKQLQESLISVTSKLDSVTSEMRSLNEKIDNNQNRVDTLAHNNQKIKPSPIGAVTTEGASNLPPAGEMEAETSFSAKAAVQKFRESMVLYEARNYPESALSFSAFVEQYPDHPLAGSAQYFLGESYFQQHEYKLAARELAQVITSFDHSTHITDTLLDLASSEDRLGNTEDASKHRQLLTSLFPHSPAGANLLLNHDRVAAAPQAEQKTDQKIIMRPEAPEKVVENPSPNVTVTHEKIDQAPIEPKSNPFPMEIVPAAKPKALNTPVSSTGLDSPPPTAPIDPNKSGGNPEQ
jgi:tol-pal system protein YbgF